MIDIECTSCNTRYRIDERVLPAEHPTFKCSRCGHVFGVQQAAAPSDEPNDNWAKLVSAAVVVGILSLAAAAWVLRLWQADLSVPIAGDFNLAIVGHDLYSELMLAKSLCDNGWIISNPYLGAPFGMQAYDLPISNFLDVAVMKVLSLYTCDHAWLLNLYFILTFPLAAVTSLIVMRTFGASYPSAITASLLFTLLPYHFLRGEGHLLLSSYWTVPLGISLMLWVWLDGAGLEPTDMNRPWSRGRLVAAGAYAVLVGLGHLYYASFASVLLLCAGIGGSLRTKKWRNLRLGVSACSVIIASCAAAASPSLIYDWEHGANPAAIARWPHEGELYGLKITRLLLPVTGHRIEAFAQLKDFYNRTLPPLLPPWVKGVLVQSSQLMAIINESDTQTLGAIAGIGFLILLGSLIWVRNGREIIHALAVLNLAALLVGLAGGLGTIFNFVVTAEIRGYNRLSVFIAFFSLFAVALLLDGLVAILRRSMNPLGAAVIWYPVLIMVVILGVLDQTTPDFAPSYEKASAEYRNDAKFVGEIESSLPAGAMILQLPYGPFPEEGAIQQMWGWDLLKGYIHSKTLRWSYGLTTGRPEASWAARLTDKPMDQVLPLLAFAGFEGIYIDRYGYPDNGADLEKGLTTVLNEQPIVSSDKRLAFFGLEHYVDSLRASTPPEQWERQHELALELPANHRSESGHP
ncbi:MAG TPA: zinc-ribbon domain-containing protein [Candidatus Binataceae bacterium]|nr:zinc-ribbon domain-containing protein [Candidatus Binataceae bacterium]